MTRLNLQRLLLAVMVLVALAACESQPQESGELPTVIVLPTLTETPPQTLTETPTPTNTATATFTGTPPATGAPTLTPSQTITDTPTRTPTPTDPPPYVPGLLDFLAQTAAVQTILPPTFLPAGGVQITPAPGTVSPITTQNAGTICPEPPSGGFGTTYFADPSLPAQLGCPISGTLTTNQPAALQAFERGQMIWVQGTPNQIYVIYSSGTYQRFIDTWQSGESVPMGEIPPAGMIEPVRGFGKVWRDNPSVKAGLGWAVAMESGTAASRQEFERGTMMHIPLRGDLLVFTHSGDPNAGTWRAVMGSY